MAAKGISIGVAADTREFSSGVKKGVIDPLDGIVDALEDVAKEGDDAGDKLERSLKASQDETERLKKDYQSLGDAIGDTSQTSSRKFSSNTKTATTGASADLKELGNEAKQNLAETLSSFDGTVEGTISGIQGTLGGVTAGLTGVGATIAAVAGAAGLGLIFAAVQSGTEETEKLREKVSELAAEYIDTGELGGASIDYIVDKVKQLALETDDSEASLKKLRDVADRSGSSFQDLADAYAGNTDELDKMIAKGEDYVDSLNDQAFAVDTTSKAEQGLYGELINKADAQEKVNDYLEEAKKVADLAAEAEANYVAAGGPELERKAALVGAINDAYDETATSVTDYVTAESGLFDVTAYLTAMQARETAIKDYQDTLNSSGLSDEAKGFLSEQGIESAALMLAGYKTAAPGQRAELDRIWTESSKTSSGAFVEGVDKTLSIYKPKPVPVPLEVDDKALTGYVPKPIRVTVDLFTRAGVRIP
jgi:cytochrome c551/c552